MLLFAALRFSLAVKQLLFQCIEIIIPLREIIEFVCARWFGTFRPLLLIVIPINDLGHVGILYEPIEISCSVPVVGTLQESRCFCLLKEGPEVIKGIYLQSGFYGLPSCF